MALNARVFRTFCCSVLSFLWQLDDLPEDIGELEHWALRRLAPGPGNWIRPPDLCHLKCYGTPFDFPSFHHSARVAKLRFIEFEPQLHWDTLRTQISDLVRTPIAAISKWHSWYHSSPVLNVLRAVDYAALLNVTASTICATLRQRLGIQHGVDVLVKKRFQAEAFRMLVTTDKYNPEHYLRCKLQRWKIDVPEGILTRRALRYLNNACQLAPNRVAVVFLRTLLNGWCTARRFQQPGSSCLFDCCMTHSDLREDSIEHYAHCPFVIAFARDKLHMPQEHVGNIAAFLCLSRDTPDDARVLQLILLYPVYGATNTLRYSRTTLQPQQKNALLMQLAQQGANGCCVARRALNAALARWRSVRPRHE